MSGDRIARVVIIGGGESAGWERPLWFAATDEEHAFHYRYGPQCWWPAAAREGEALRDRVALLDLSPFTKIDLEGRESLELMQQLCANDVDVAEGRVVYWKPVCPSPSPGTSRVDSSAATRCCVDAKRGWSVA